MAPDYLTSEAFRSEGDADTIANPRDLHEKDADEPAADAARPSGVSPPADTADPVSVELIRCGWCGGTQFSYVSQESGQIYCTCGSIYRPLTGRWDPGDRDKQQSPLVSMPATDSMTQAEIGKGLSKATASSTAGGRAVMDGQ
jgi:hypothetical protein